MIIRFEVGRVIQAAAVLLNTTEAKRMSRLRLLKLLYIADRESIGETEQPITGDEVIALDHGPVLSRTYDLINGEEHGAVEWRRHFHMTGQDVQLENDPGIDELSRYDVRKLREVAARFEDENDWAIAEYTHTFGEWVANQPEKGSSRRVPVEDILTALGMSDAYEEIMADAKSRRNVDRAIARAAVEPAPEAEMRVA